jgi:fused signal recognition particle receptor
MFEKLKSAISYVSSITAQKTLSINEVEKILFNFELALIESDVAQEVVEELLNNLKREIVGSKIDRSTKSIDYIRYYLQESIKKILNSDQINIIELITKKKTEGEPYTILFLGINGTGKTTTVAKFAHFLKSKDFSVVIACADTYRAGAIEQLSKHAESIGVKVISQRYGSDPASIGRDGIFYARTHHVDVVLIDTAGRIQTSKNLMDEMGKIIRVVKPDLKIFVGDALAGNDVIYQAKEFKSITDFDATILTKVDADVKGGAALSITYVTRRPILFLGNGQTYDSLISFDSNNFVSELTEN